MTNLARRSIIGSAQLVLAIGICVFAPAWTFRFWQAWVYLFVFAGSSALITVYLWKHDPKLLERRLHAGPGREKSKAQNWIQLLASVAVFGMMVLSSIDHRFAWSRVPVWLVIVGDALVALGFWITFIVFRANSFAASTIDVAPEQVVVSTGPYAVVRHPMYAAALLIFAGAPLAIGSLWGLVMLVPLTLILAWRLLDEEKLLAERLPGYGEYCLNVRYRLAPFIW